MMRLLFEFYLSTDIDNITPLSVVLPLMSVFSLIMMNRLLRTNFRKIITRIISRHSRDGNSLESMMMKASAVHHWSIAKECSS